MSTNKMEIWSPSWPNLIICTLALWSSLLNLPNTFSLQVLEKRRLAASKGQGTTHWPHEFRCSDQQCFSTQAIVYMKNFLSAQENFKSHWKFYNISRDLLQKIESQIFLTPERWPGWTVGARRSNWSSFHLIWNQNTGLLFDTCLASILESLSPFLANIWTAPP